MISNVAVGASVVMFLVAAVDQYFFGGVKPAVLYFCFAMTNIASLWIGMK
jgi:hypothetical protein